jgi:hypothetical protein
MKMMNDDGLNASAMAARVRSKKQTTQLHVNTAAF